MFRPGSTALAFLFAVVSTTSSAFLLPSPCHHGRSRISTLQRASDPNNDKTPDEQQLQPKQPDPVEIFMEQASQKGADKIRKMSIEERTRRAMMAEAVEDRIFSMYDDLEGLLKDGVPSTDEDRDEIQSLAKEIKASQSHYESLVSGEPSAMMGTINDIGAQEKNKDGKGEGQQ